MERSQADGPLLVRCASENLLVSQATCPSTEYKHLTCRVEPSSSPHFFARVPGPLRTTSPVTPLQQSHLLHFQHSTSTSTSTVITTSRTLAALPPIPYGLPPTKPSARRHLAHTTTLEPFDEAITRAFCTFQPASFQVGLVCALWGLTCIVSGCADIGATVHHRIELLTSRLCSALCCAAASVLSFLGSPGLKRGSGRPHYRQYSLASLFR